MSNNESRIQTQAHNLRSATEHATLDQPTEQVFHGDCSNRVRTITEVALPADRVRWAAVLAGLIVVVLPVVMVGCGGNAGSPAPTSLAPGTAPVTTIGAGVPLEPGSNLPPVEGDDETVTTSTG